MAVKRWAKKQKQRDKMTSMESEGSAGRKLQRGGRAACAQANFSCLASMAVTAALDDARVNAAKKKELPESKQVHYQSQMEQLAKLPRSIKGVGGGGGAPQHLETLPNHSWTDTQ